MMWYGSDTLVAHPSNLHSREHLCKHCHQKIWVHYSHAYFKRLLTWYLLFVSAASGAGTILLSKAGMQLDNLQTIGFIAFLFCLGTPLAITYARFRSVVVHKEEKIPAF